MEKSFRSLAQDPWNKLKIYFCLRKIEENHAPVERSTLLLQVAKAKRATDPVLALLLCEAALKSTPEESVVIDAAREVLREWLPDEGEKQAALRRKAHDSTRQSIAKLGIDGYFRQLAEAKGIGDDVLSGFQGYQPSWQGVIQFLELLKLKNAIPVELWASIRDEVEATLADLEPDHPDLGRIRHLASA
jgi:hypothetical protein